MRVAIAGVVCFLLGVHAAGEPAVPQYAEFPPTSGRQYVLIDRVKDGDSVRGYFLVPADFRLAGVAAPEIRGDSKEAGLRSKEALASKLKSDKVYVFHLSGKDKYGRTLCEPLDAGGGSICAWMIQKGFAEKWDGTGEQP